MGNALPGRIIQALLLVLAVAIVARVVWAILGPLVPGLIVIVLLAALGVRVLSGPRGDR